MGFIIDANSEAAQVAKDMMTFTTGAPKAMSLQLLAAAHILQFGIEKKFLDGGEEEMLYSAKEAVEIFDQLGDTASSMGAQQVLTSARSIAELNQEDAQMIAQVYGAIYKTG